MATTFSFQTQIASILDVLVKAAVTEICKLVDDGSEMLRVEMCRRDNEIEVLNRKLHLMENELWAALKQSAANSCSVGIQVDGQLQRTDKADHATFGAGASKKLYFQHDSSEEDSGVSVTRAHGREGRDTLDAAGGFEEQCSSGLTVDEQDEEEFLVKAEEDEAVLAQKDITTAANNVSKDRLCVEQAVDEAESPLQSRFKQERGEVKANDTSCSYVTGQESQAVPCPAELLPVRGSDEISGTHLSSLTNSYPDVLRSASVTRDLAGTVRCNGFHKAKRARTHSAAPREKWFICTQCGKSFDRFSHLERHQRIHTGEKPYSCATCGKCFSQKSSLKGHQRVHTGERPYSCNMCRKTFSCLSNRNAHQCRHTLLRAYSCYLCGSTYSHLGALKMHQKTHTEDKS